MESRMVSGVKRSAFEFLSDRVERLQGVGGSRGSDQIAGTLDKRLCLTGANVLHDDH